MAELVFGENGIAEENVVSLEDLRALLEAKGLDIRQLAREAKELKEKKEMMVEESVNKVSSSTGTAKKPEFELALANYPDFAIRRSSAKTEKLLVIMPSLNAYYIKSVKNGAETKETLTREGYVSFTSGMPEITFPEGFWIKVLNPGAKVYDGLTLILGNEHLRKAIVGRYLEEIPNLGRDGVSLWSVDISKYEAIPSLLKEFSDSEKLKVCWLPVFQIQEKFGIENARDFVRELELSLAEDLGGSYSHNRSIAELKDPKKTGPFGELFDLDFKFESFKNYVLYDSVRMGFAKSMRNFFYTWNDTINMQKKVYRKIKEKYPEHLLELHNQLSYKCVLMKQQINEECFRRRVNEASRFEASIGGFVFLAPHQPQDFYDEATAQSNCLASYVDRYADGKDYIFFMRKKESPEVSLVTIELDLDGRLRQAFQARNTAVTAEQRTVINKWLAEVVAPQLSVKIA